MRKTVISTLLLFSTLLSASSIDKMVDEVGSANKNGANTQKKINVYVDESDKLFDEYSLLSKELNEQKLYNKQLELFVSTQKKEIPKLQTQLKEIVQTHKKIIPLMFEMVNTMDKLVAVDSPFLHNERTQRVNNLKSYLSNSDITMSEQFRMIMDSYKIEYSYARTLEVYRSKFNEGDSKTVDFLRVGRFAFYYQSLDLQESGIYDLDNKRWITLEKKYNQDITKAIKMARKKIAPDFLTLPILSAKAGK